MAIDSAKALWAKIASDPDVKKAFSDVKDEKAFEELIAQFGYSCTMKEFLAAKDSFAEEGDLNDETLSQVSGGLSLVGVDYAFTAVKSAG